MGTRYILGIMGRDGKGVATFGKSDGYPTGVGRGIMENWDDAEKLEAVIRGGEIASFAVTYFPDTIESLSQWHEMRMIMGTEKEVPVFYFREGSGEFPMELSRETGFFELEWAWDIEYVYLMTPDGLMGKWMWGEDARVLPVTQMISDYEGLMRQEAEYRAREREGR